MRVLRGLLAGCALLAMLAAPIAHAGAPSPASGTQKANAILDRMEARMAPLRDFTAKLQARVSLPLLPGVLLHGRVLYKKPNRVKVELDNLPRFVERYKGDFSGLAPTGRNRKDYVSRWVRDEAVDGRACHLLLVEPKNPADKIKVIMVWVDRADLTVPRGILEYKDGTVLKSSTLFKPVGRFLLPSVQQMQFTLPRLAGQATAMYSDYRLNAGLTDADFSSVKKKG